MSWNKNCIKFETIWPLRFSSYFDNVSPWLYVLDMLLKFPGPSESPWGWKGTGLVTYGRVNWKLSSRSAPTGQPIASVGTVWAGCNHPRHLLLLFSEASLFTTLWRSGRGTAGREDISGSGENIYKKKTKYQIAEYRTQNIDSKILTPQNIDVAEYRSRIISSRKI